MSAVSLKRWTREEYDRPADRGDQTVRKFRPGETIIPLGAPLARIAVDDLLP